jgi:rhodanese-related sulfurtransferase
MASGRHADVLRQTTATPESFAAEHIPGAIHLHHARIDESTLRQRPSDTLFVVDVVGPPCGSHCSGAHVAALAIARLGCRVEKLIGGETGWLDEGFTRAGS